MSQSRSSLALLLGIAGCADPVEHNICTDIGCEDSTMITVSSRLSVQELARSRVRACVNATCIDEVMADGVFALDVVRDGLTFSLRFGELAANLELRVGISLDQGYAANGDVYTLDVWSGAGDQRVARRWSAEYELSMPNGPMCTPTCRIGALDATNAD